MLASRLNPATDLLQNLVELGLPNQPQTERSLRDRPLRLVLRARPPSPV